MKTLFTFGFVCFLAVTVAGSSLARHSPEHVEARSTHLLGTKECTWGPSYWCKNLTTAAGCHAGKHCTQTVWMHQKLEPDHNSVCQTCLDMVKQARDQLLSNETEEEIKEVFEGSCKLIPLKVVADECCKLVDEFSVDLIDALASQMNPQIVCSIAGLCNSPRVQELVEQQKGELAQASTSLGGASCDNCHLVMGIVERKFRSATHDQVLQGFMKVCGRLGSLSDACSNIVITYFSNIYKHLEDNLNPNEVCLMVGECSAQFHSHVNVEITPLSKVGVVPVNGPPDLPCDLCKQLVQHLQDILIANTTESEFHQVLVGICGQTGQFKEECLSIVNEYYPMIYNFLVTELNGNVLCAMIGICPGDGLSENSAPTMPLLPLESIQNLQVITDPIIPIGAKKGSSSPLQALTPESAQLPIERLMPQTLTIIGNTQLCEFCQQFLHFVQNVITERSTEEEIEQVVDKACSLLPGVNETCREFVAQYGPAMVALLAQKIDPSTLCPKLSLCPAQDALDIVEVFMHDNKGGKSKCPMCLFAITSLEELIKNKKTEENIRRALSSLCSHLRDDLKDECLDFVDAYTNQIVEACIADLTPQEICVYLQMCPAKAAITPSKPVIDYGGLVETNEIPDYTMYGKPVPQKPVGSNTCILCEFVMTQIDEQLKNNATEQEIIEVVHGICNYLPKSLSGECNTFVNQYADMVIQLLVQELDPKEVCVELSLCNKNRNTKRLEIQVIDNTKQLGENLYSPQCTLCKLVMTQIESILQGKISEDEVINAVHRVCNMLPAAENRACNDFIDKHGDQIIKLIELAIQPGEICSILFLCESDLNMIRVDVRKCSVCHYMVEIMDKILENPNVDHKIEHVFEKTCSAIQPTYQPLCRDLIDIYGDKLIHMLLRSVDPLTICNHLDLCGKRNKRSIDESLPLPGANKCSRGPGYWCINEDNANECGEGAVTHCQTHVWTQEPDLPGANKCTRGPGYWCINEDNANECGEGALTHCKTYVWSQQPHLIGANKCVRGPGYWCESENNANECGEGAVAHCKTYVWNLESSLPGANKCARGPGYWCQSETNANECGAINHCQTNVWNNATET